jgi:cytoskeleton protein RodZ
MKSVGQQLQEARLAKNWTPELAARETKIKADRVRDLEADDYTHFSSPAYARGFVRTYARALGLDEYKILRLLDNKLPEDDNASFANDTGMPYVPEPSQTMHVSSAPRTGLYVVLGLFCAIVLIISFVLLQAYRAGELPRYFASTASPDSAPPSSATNLAPVQDAEAPAHALPVDPNDTGHSVRALPVDLNAVAAAPVDTHAAPAASTNAPAVAAAPAVPVEAVPVAAPAPEAASPVVVPVAAAAPPPAPAIAAATPPPPADAATNAAPATNTAPISMAVNSSVPPLSAPTPADNAAPSTTSADAPTAASTPSTSTTTTSDAVPVAEAVAAPPVTAPAATPASDSSPPAKVPPRALPVSASELAADEATSQGAAGTPSGDNGTMLDLGTSASSTASGKRLVLTASRDSFVRVTAVHGSQGNEVLYASVLRQGQSLSFDGHKFSVNVGVPSAVDIMLDGVNYGPHSDGNSPETFTLESHQP